jgi:hypothetical protein
VKNPAVGDDFSHSRQCLASRIESDPYDNSMAHSFVLDLRAYDTLLTKLPWSFDCGGITAGYTDNPADSPER